MKPLRAWRIVGLVVLTEAFVAGGVHGQELLPDAPRVGVHLTAIERYEYGERLYHLANGAVFENRTVTLLPGESHVQAVLYPDVESVGLWVHGHGTYEGELRRAPEEEPNYFGTFVWVREIDVDRNWMRLGSDEVLTFSASERRYVEKWRTPFRAILLRDGRLFPLNQFPAFDIRVAAMDGELERLLRRLGEIEPGM